MLDSIFRRTSGNPMARRVRILNGGILVVTKAKLWLPQFLAGLSSQRFG